MAGHLVVIQELKALTIAQSVAMFALEELFQMLISNVVFMLDLTYPELMLRSCQVNGNIKLAHVREFKLEITCGLQDIFL
jgi:hypothetical protein